MPAVNRRPIPGVSAFYWLREQSPPSSLKASPLLKTVWMTIEEILEEFDALETWEDRCEFLIDLGMELPEFPEEERTEANRVHGCQSNVWMVLRPRTNDPGVIDISADSDAMIVRGLIAVLLALYSGKRADEILQIDARDVFRRLGLDRHLSPARRNGLNGMVQRIRDYARQVAQQSAVSGSR